MNGMTTNLRPAITADAQAVADWLGPTSPAALVGARDRATPMDVEEIAEDIRSRPGHHFIIRTRKGEEVGVLEWRWLPSKTVRTATLGGAIGDPALWKFGYGIDALFVLFAHLFYDLNAHRVQFSTSAGNEVVTSVLRGSHGPTLEGVLREAIYLDGHYEDTVLWAILRSEFDEMTATPDLLAIESANLARSNRVHQQIADEVRAHRRTSLDELLARHPARVAGGTQEVLA